MDRINGEMTVKEAIPFCSPAQQISLQHWAETFDVRLRDFHVGHIRAYEIDRLREVDSHIVGSEVGALLSLLELAGVGNGIRNDYRPLPKSDELSSEESDALPEKVQEYIKKLESDLRDLNAEHERVKDRLRKANWARKRY
jgi:hypothetical protein